MSRVIGIDLGTTNSVVAILENHHPEVIQNAEGAKTTPSVVHFTDSGDVIVGELAKRQLALEPERTIRSAKRFMGCRWNEAEDRREGIAYGLSRESESDLVVIEVAGRVIRPEQVAAEVLKKMKETAEAFLGEEVLHAVITVPAHFNDTQRQATKLAAEHAGLEALRIINEPTAAALAYGLNRNEHEKVAVFDFGGGTFDISILDLDGDIIEVKATGGDTFLGGDNITRIIEQWILEQFREETGIDLALDAKACQRIAQEAEKVKCELSTLKTTTVSLPFIAADDSGPKHFAGELDREQFKTMIAPILERLRPPCEQVLVDAGLKPEDLTSVVLVGGSSRIPAVREMARDLFGREPNRSINPDEVVACGAAIQAGIMRGEMAELLLLDVTPLSLGIELAGDVFSTLIPRNSSIPTIAHRKFTTVIDNQSTVKIHVLQGERKIASENRSLAHFRLTDIPPAPREIPEVEVSFNIDANGILTVGAVDLTSGAGEEVAVESFWPASEEEVEQIAEDAEKHAAEDKLFMQKAAVRRRLQEMEAHVESLRQRTAETRISHLQDGKIKEAFFKLDLALTRDEWDCIDEAERNAKAVFMEITSLLSLQSAASTPPASSADEVILDSALEQNKTDH